MKGTVTLLAVVVLACLTGIGAQVTPGSRVIVLVVDDLHLDFRGTPLVRELLARVVKEISSVSSSCLHGQRAAPMSGFMPSIRET